MAICCPADLDTVMLRAEIQSIYARVATSSNASIASAARLRKGSHGNTASWG